MTRVAFQVKFGRYGNLPYHIDLARDLVPEGGL